MPSTPLHPAPPGPTLTLTPAPVPCRGCGTILKASHAAGNDFCCPGCGEPACYTCGCTELRACTEVATTRDGARGVTLACSWAEPGLCSFCVSRVAYELYMEATGRPADDPRYLRRGRDSRVVLGLGAGLDQREALEAGFRERWGKEGP